MSAHRSPQLLSTPAFHPDLGNSCLPHMQNQFLSHVLYHSKAKAVCIHCLHQYSILPLTDIFLFLPEIEIIFPCTGSIESDFAEVITLISIHIPECCVRIAGHTPNGVVKYSDAVYAALKI